MSTLFRALWQDPREDIVSRAETAFVQWVDEKYPGLALDDTFQEQRCTNGIEVRVRARFRHAVAGGLTAFDALLFEELTADSWATRVHVAVEGAQRWVAIEVRLLSDEPHGGASVAAPRLCRRLLETVPGAPAPTLGRLELLPVPHDIGVQQARAFADLVDDESRQVPLIVFTRIDSHERPGRDGDRAIDRTARALAGVAIVVELDGMRLAAFNGGLDAEMGVWGGAARLYLPGRHRPARHRYLRAAELAQDTGLAADVFARVLAQSMVGRRDPAPLQRARVLLRANHGGASGTVDTDEFEARAIDAERRVGELDDELIELADDNEKLGAERQRLLGRALHAESELERLAGRTPPPRWLGVPVPLPTVVPDFVRAHLNKVTLPAAACRELGRLDDAITAEVWGRKCCEVFIAMQAYAERARDYRGDFRHWAMHSGDERTFGLGSRIAMQESETTVQSTRYKAARTLPIDPRVMVGERVLMVAHVRIVIGGGANIPRIFFHDDTRGLTRRMHVGFYGPRYLVPNASES